MVFKRQSVAANKEGGVEYTKFEIELIYKLGLLMELSMPKKPQSQGLTFNNGVQSMIDYFKNTKTAHLVKEQLVRFICRVVNEENGFG